MSGEGSKPGAREAVHAMLLALDNRCFAAVGARDDKHIHVCSYVTVLLEDETAALRADLDAARASLALVTEELENTKRQLVGATAARNSALRKRDQLRASRDLAILERDSARALLDPVRREAEVLRNAETTRVLQTALDRASQPAPTEGKAK